MHVCLINGSLRGQRGVTHRLLNSLASGIERAGGSSDLIDLAGLRIESCRACDNCQTTETYRCIFDERDDCTMTFERMTKADMLVYGSPVYLFGLSSLLKRLLERVYSRAPIDGNLLTKSGLFFHATDRSLLGKPFASVVVCDNMEDMTVRSAADYFYIFGRFLDAPRVGHLERREAAAWLAALEGTDDRARKRAEGVLDAYARAGEELVTKGSVGRRTKRAAEAHFIDIPLPVRIARHIPVLRPAIDKEVRKRTGPSRGFAEEKDRKGGTNR